MRVGCFLLITATAMTTREYRGQPLCKPNWHCSLENTIDGRERTWTVLKQLVWELAKPREQDEDVVGDDDDDDDDVGGDERAVAFSPFSSLKEANTSRL
jgi:hypothetical protein